MTRRGTITGLLGMLIVGWATPSAYSAQPPATRAPSPCTCAPGIGIACWPAELRGYYRGCPGSLPKVKSQIAPDLTSVARPYPSGEVVLQLGINEKGLVVSACVLRGVRSDFDQAAQAAALHWRWSPCLLHGQPIGAIEAITICTPDRNCLHESPALPTLRVGAALQPGPA